MFKLRLGFVSLAIALGACQPPAPPVSTKWCDFTGTKPAQAPVPTTGAWSFLRCYGDGRLEKSTICLAFPSGAPGGYGAQGGAAAKPADNTFRAPLFVNWQDGRLVLRTCAPGDSDCSGVTFTLDAMDAFTMYGTFNDGKTTGQARATLEAARDCALSPDQEFIPERTPSPSATASPSVSPSPSPSDSHAR